MISVAAELAEMHPQTLRMYEARGLIEPKRSPKGTRLYSQQDVERLRRIQEMTTELGMNLAGVERVLELEQELEPMAAQGRPRSSGAPPSSSAEVRAARSAATELRAEIVPYERGGELIRHADLQSLNLRPGVTGARRSLRTRWEEASAGPHQTAGVRRVGYATITCVLGPGGRPRHVAH